MGAENPMATEHVGRRVRDLWAGDEGTVVEGPVYCTGRARYRVAWDRPTPHQDTAWAQVPSRFFAWAEED